MRLLIKRLIVIAILSVIMASCSLVPSQKSQPSLDEQGAKVEQIPTTVSAPKLEPAVATPLPDTGLAVKPDASQLPDRTARIQQNPAVLALLSDAAQARAAGDYWAAQGSLQRAQRIAPKDPEIYYSLAVTHMEQEDYGLAEQVALKGVSVAPGNDDSLRRLWQLIAKIRLHAGNLDGSRQAEQKATNN